MTVDEEIALLEDGMRKLKIEFDMYFGGGAKRARGVKRDDIGKLGAALERVVRIAKKHGLAAH